MSNEKTDAKALRDSIRNSILTAKPERKELTLFGQQIEIVQPPLEVILQAQQSENTAQAMATMLIRYVFVPGTDTPVFEPTDTQAILKLPFGRDMQALQDAINDLTGVESEVAEQAKNLVSSQPS